ncbi:MAG: M48 family metallopeptidase [bacterium]|jgi:predicted metal-dependent hydrolase|nr:M48 family metallopeptidase [candidate division KSB1 bacterium]MDH7559888.1 M48 family metallopeptidase [bacterium]
MKLTSDEPPGLSGAPLQEAVARDILLAEVHAWARRIGVEERIREIHLRPMKRKWASLSSRGRLTLSVEPLTQTPAFRRQVMVHELVHLKVPNHGRLFKALVKAYLAEAQDAPRHPSGPPPAPFQGCARHGA